MPDYWGWRIQRAHKISQSRPGDNNNNRGCEARNQTADDGISILLEPWSGAMTARSCRRCRDIERIGQGASTEVGLAVLIIKRKLGEKVQIANDIIITVKEIHAHEVSIGIDAPREVIVDRMEVAERRRKERAASSVTAARGRKR